MTAIEQLKNEHQAILQVLAILEVICQRLKDGQKVDPQHLKQILEFIQVFADRCHHGKEEELLFKEMNKAGISEEGGPVNMMLVEHKAGRNFVKNLKKAVKDYQQNKTAKAEIIQNAQGYIDLLRNHIAKEDQVLYPMAEEMLPQSVQDELLKKFDEVEEKKIGVGKHEQFHQMIKKLAKIYL